MNINQEIQLELEKAFSNEDSKTAGFIKGARWSYTLLLDKLQTWLSQNVSMAFVYTEDNCLKGLSGSELFECISEEFIPVYKTTDIEIH